MVSRGEVTIDPPVTTSVGEQVTAKEIVVTVSGTPDDAALCLAAEQSRVTGVPLRIVHAWQISDSPSGDAGVAFWVASAADARARATRWVLDALGQRAGTVRWVLDIVELPADMCSEPGGSA